VLALSGGSAARFILPLLSTELLPWDRIRITLVDERWVPSTHPDSNEALVRASLSRRAKAANIIGLYDGSRSPADAAETLKDKLPPLDVILLGMGEDGHIASLFPNDPANFSREPLAAVAGSDHPRLTLTPRALTQAEAIILAFTGSTKARIFNRALADGPAAELPVRHILRANTSVFIGP